MPRVKKEGKLATKPKEWYRLPREIMDLLKPTETEEEVTAYFEDIRYCIELNICTDCGQGVIFNDTNRDEHVKEYGISGLCKACQIKAFGE